MEIPFAKPTREECLAFFVTVVTEMKRQGYYAQVHKEFNTVIISADGATMVLNKAEALDFMESAENMYFFYQGQVSHEDIHLYLISAFIDLL